MDAHHFLAHHTGPIPYAIVRSDRRTLAVSVARDGTVRVRAPRRVSEAEIIRLVGERASWIARKREEFARLVAEGAVEPLGAHEMADARRVFAERCEACWAVFARPGERAPQLRVRAMRSRWGSLSASGRMSLNAYLVRAPEECIDSVIFHELCHLRVRNHGPAFYSELATYVPEWKQRRRELRHMLG